MRIEFCDLKTELYDTVSYEFLNEFLIENKV